MYRIYPALFFLCFSIYVCVVSWRLDLGSLQKPGSGFMPFWSAAVIGILAAILLVQEARAGRGAASKETKERTLWSSVGLTLGYFLGYILTLEYLGFIVGTVIFVGLILKTIEKKAWFLTAWVSLTVSLACYYLFRVWLQAELPKGVLDF